MEIDLESIPPEGLTIEGAESPGIMDLPDATVEFLQPIHYRVHASRVGNMVLVKGELSTIARFCCSRCLKEFESLIAVPDFRAQKEATAPQGIIDLTDAVREDIILALPAKPLCEAGCRGLCPRCGRDLNAGICDCHPPQEDSPFAALNGIA